MRNMSSRNSRWRKVCAFKREWRLNSDIGSRRGPCLCARRGWFCDGRWCLRGCVRRFHQRGLNGLAAFRTRRRLQRNLCCGLNPLCLQGCPCSLLLGSGRWNCRCGPAIGKRIVCGFRLGFDRSDRCLWLPGMRLLQDDRLLGRGVGICCVRLRRLRGRGVLVHRHVQMDRFVRIPLARLKQRSVGVGVHRNIVAVDLRHDRI